MIFKNGIVFSREGFNAIDFEIKNGVISKLEHDIDVKDYIDLEDKLVIPGLVDIHTHGCIGYDFGDATKEQMQQMASWYIKNGTTSLLPTIVTLDKTLYKQQIVNIVDNYSEKSPFMGINLEGPFISKIKKGSHNEKNIIEIDMQLVENLWQDSQDSIKLMTVAPEKSNFDKLMEYSKDKFKLSLGHTACDLQTAKNAIEIGATHITHIFNAMNQMHHREPSLVGAALKYPITKELICDGLHIDDVILEMMFKNYSEELVIISDSLASCGLGDGNYSLGKLDVVVKENKATLRDGTIAGSNNTMFDNIKHLVDIGINIRDAINSATILPAKAVGIDDKVGILDIGYRADFLICNKNFKLLEVYKNGEKQ
ncbi:N-acetylglucosamine-6-phosphate deacetylase [Sedimentibacter sp. zth1]|uniref:N-acetylglucosamine-6-phosphate deacetylase n=1 Tax=Sedimentibacter sp. zth1 TaxID=2816908 RepID=UPI001A922B24|nr:N-acetylglucosamine-6-phosphate deacetylase [Sedimentibacter sp. zth1]QSX05376.1 N-acetylglucosamine-6-phosphate deacetylase [Sedimentibacter sp. zth1]